jgi:hypothetical protein
MIARTFLGFMIAIAMVSGSAAQDNKTSDSDGLLPQPNSRLTASSPSQLPNGCTFNISIQKANEFVDSQIAEYAKRTETILADAQEIKGRMQRSDCRLRSSEMRSRQFKM